jgi:CheY-like chemotaxis protein
MNLITNASEAMEDEGGRARVETSLFEADLIYLSECELGMELKPGRYVRLTVADTGPGISEEIRANIFDPFFSTKFTGRGLGLAAALGIVQSHRAALRVDSDPETGTRFSILFPPSAASVEPPTSTQPAVIEAETGGKAILIVDDEAVVRDVARAMLQSAKYKVLVACDGTEAVEIFEKDGATIDLVLLDMAMPGMDGKETYEALRAIRNDVLVLLSSGYTEEEAVSQLGANGAVDFVHKPYKLKTLLEMVKKSLTG